MGKRCTRDDPCLVAVCTAIWFEIPYLREWLVYHLLQVLSEPYLRLPSPPSSPCLPCRHWVPTRRPTVVRHHAVSFHTEVPARKPHHSAQLPLPWK